MARGGFYCRLVSLSLWALVSVFVCMADIRHEGAFVVTSETSTVGEYTVYDSVASNAAGNVSGDAPDVVLSLDLFFVNFVNDTLSRVRDRLVFYNNSVWDNFNVLANADDDSAIARDKVAAFSNQNFSFVNYTSYTKGINGLMVDFVNLASPDLLTLADFEFKTSVTSEFSEAAPTPSDFIVRELSAGVHRVTIVFEDGAISDRWLRVKVLANARTGLEGEDVFYFGNVVGSATGSRASAGVGVGDVTATHTKIAGGGSVSALSPYDFDRNGKVDIEDVLVAFNSITGPEPVGDVLSSLQETARNLGLPEDRLEFEARSALSLLRTDVLTASLKILLLPGGRYYLELDRLDWILSYSLSLEESSWKAVEEFEALKVSGNGWVIDEGDLPSGIFFRASKPEE